MENITQIVQQVKQAPWRVQRQWIGLALLVMVLAAMVAGVYINTTARAAVYGRQVQILNGDIETARQQIADSEVELAQLTSNESMQARAVDLGFQPVSSGEVTYLQVAGYTPRAPAVKATTTDSPPTSLIKAEYTETLLDWFTRQMLSAGGRP